MYSTSNSLLLLLFTKALAQNVIEWDITRELAKPIECDFDDEFEYKSYNWMYIDDDGVKIESYGKFLTLREINFRHIEEDITYELETTCQARQLPLDEIKYKAYTVKVLKPKNKVTPVLAIFGTIASIMVLTVAIIMITLVMVTNRKNQLVKKRRAAKANTKRKLTACRLTSALGPGFQRTPKAPKNTQKSAANFPTEAIFQSEQIEEIAAPQIPQLIVAS